MLFFIIVVQSGEEDAAQGRIDEESDSPQDETPKALKLDVVDGVSTSYTTNDRSKQSIKKYANFLMIFQQQLANFTEPIPIKCATKQRYARMSRPIPIGLHHTVCGSEALNLAKRLNEELATQQATQGGSLGNPQPTHNRTEREEPRSRSFEQGVKSKGMRLYRILLI